MFKFKLQPKLPHGQNPEGALEGEGGDARAAAATSPSVIEPRLPTPRAGTWSQPRMFLKPANTGMPPKSALGYIYGTLCLPWCTRWHSWFRHCATSRKVAGSIPDGVTGTFDINSPGCTTALGLTQPVTEMSTRNISCGGKGGRCVGLSTLPPSRADCFEIWEPQPLGTLRAWSRPVTGLLYFWGGGEYRCGLLRLAGNSVTPYGALL